MKLSKRSKETLGLSLLISAISLVITFLALSIRRRSFVQALLVLAAAEGTAAGLLLADKEGKLPRFRKKVPVEGEEETEDAELFDEETGRVAEAELKEVLGGWREEEGAPSARARREIPRDEEATEQDFQ